MTNPTTPAVHSNGRPLETRCEPAAAAAAAAGRKEDGVEVLGAEDAIFPAAVAGAPLPTNC